MQTTLTIEERDLIVLALRELMGATSSNKTAIAAHALIAKLGGAK